MADFNYMGARLSLFSGKVSEKATRFFRDVWDDDPDTFQSAPPGAIGGGSTASGLKQGVTAAVTVQPGRVDFSYGPPAAAEVTSIQFVGGELLSAAIDRTLSALPKIAANRVACFLSLGRVAPDYGSANKFLVEAMDQKYRPSRLTQEEDFSFQYNIPTVSKSLESVLNNQLSRFSVERVNLLVFSAQNGFVPSINENLVATIGLDYNNKPASTSLTSQELRALGRELQSLAFEDARKYSSKDISA